MLQSIKLVSKITISLTKKFLIIKIIGIKRNVEVIIATICLKGKIR